MSNRWCQDLTPGPSRKRKERDDALDAQPSPPNRLVAGYLAHEFLTSGTLFGQRWDPARTEAVPVGPTKIKRPVAADAPNKPQAYADMANLLKNDGAHIPGIVNPTQLVQWLQM